MLIEEPFVRVPGGLLAIANLTLLDRPTFLPDFHWAYKANADWLAKFCSLFTLSLPPSQVRQGHIQRAAPEPFHNRRHGQALIGKSVCIEPLTNPRRCPNWLVPPRDRGRRLYSNAGSLHSIV